MSQAAPDPSAAAAAQKAHYVLDEDRRGRLKMISLALEGMAELCHDGSIDMASEPADISRERLGAIFTVFQRHLDETISDMPFTYARKH